MSMFGNLIDDFFGPRDSFGQYDHRRMAPRSYYGRAIPERRGEDRKTCMRKEGKDGFQIHINVKHFGANDISVKTVNDSIVVEGKHEEKQDEYGFISRHFTWRYILPKEYDPKDVISSISTDGILTVRAPPKVKPPVDEKERVVSIQRTGSAHPVKERNPPASPVKETPKEEAPKEPEEEKIVPISTLD